MVSVLPGIFDRNFIGEHVGVNFVAQHATIATVLLILAPSASKTSSATAIVYSRIAISMIRKFTHLESKMGKQNQ